MAYLYRSHADSTRIAKFAPLFVLAILTACSSLGSAGPSRGDVKSASSRSVDNANIKVVDVTDAVTRRMLEGSRSTLFSETLGEIPASGTIIGPGDVLEITIWEAPPAALFGAASSFGPSDLSSSFKASGGSVQKTGLPEMTVDSSGSISIPFAGSITAAGHTPRQLERLIASRLTGKAHDPQVAVRLVGNATANVTVVGEVATNTRMPLSPRGERLLDALATAGGAKQPIGKTTIQITRGTQVVSLPLETVIRDPAQNVRLRADDVVTVLFQPFSFTSLGATGTSAEHPFEATGLTLAQALGRVGGLKDDRADARGVFIFRLEDPASLDPAIVQAAQRTPDGRIPVIYRIDLRDPATFFIAQSFPIRNKDILYVTTAPVSDFQRFVSMVSSVAFTAIGLGQAVR